VVRWQLLLSPQIVGVTAVETAYSVRSVSFLSFVERTKKKNHKQNI
jgi:hypothetical protein